MESKENIVDQLLCISCLCVGRSLHRITDETLKQYYLNILNEIPLCSMSRISCPSICFECVATLKKVISFREQVKESYRILQTYTNETLQECLLSDVSRPPRLIAHNNEAISITPAECVASAEDINLIDVKSEENHNENIDIDEQNISSPEDCKEEREEHNNSSPNVYKGELSDNLDIEREIKEIIGDKRSRRVKEKRSKKLKSDKKNLHEPPRLETHINETAGTTPADENVNLYDTHWFDVKIELKPEWNVDIEEHNIPLSEDYKGKRSDNLDIEREINEIISDKRSKSKRSKKLKSDRKQLKHKNTVSKKIVTIELTYEQMLEERNKEATRDNYVKAEYKCESCIIGFNYSKSYESHIANKHSSNLGEYSCPLCKTIVPSVDSFTAHYKRHMRRYECNICHKRTQDLKVMKQHYYTTHEITLKQYQCNMCGKISNSIDSHRYHKDTHKARVQCSECDKTFRHRAGLMNHRLAVHELHNAFPCTLCDKVFRWKTSLKRHLEKHEVKTNTASAAFCAPCDISFSSVCSYQRHLKNSLKHVTQDQFRYICDHCNRRFSDKTKLRDHIEEKHLNKTYHCHICLKPSKNRVGLDQHIRNVHKGRPNNKMCHHCGKGFPTKVQLESHIRTHTGERPFICEYCPTTFSQQSNLYKHNRQVHLNIKSKRLLNKKLKDKVDDGETKSIQVSAESARPVALYYAGNTGFVM